MGRIASEKSNVTVVTSDNPRTEDPATIMEEVLTGVLKGREVIAQVDRHEAIRTALSLARKGDVVLIAGKGHENYQVVGTTKHHFDDREEVMNFIREKG
jgi:UDP-N-acetylmuramoyl-L-alanyl-D-glutamate--2,6-diaminopimelate ligase